MNQRFLELLAEKLKGISDLRSIYLNCLPRKLKNRLDIFDLNDNEIISSQNWAGDKSQ